MNVMLLCAGTGSRLQPYTLTKPKPLIPFLGVPLVCYSLSLLDNLPVNNLVINLFHLPDQIKKFFEHEPVSAKKIIYSEEKDGLLGSGGGIHKAFESLQGRGAFMVMNADEVILPFEPFLLQEMIRYHHWHKGIATLLTMQHPEVGHQFGGAWVDKNNQVNCFAKKTPPNTTLQGQHFLGVMILEERIQKFFKYGYVEENILYETLTLAMSQHQDVFTFPIQANWFETGNPSDFLTATKSCLELMSTSNQFPSQYLRQTVTKYSRREIFIEDAEPALKKKVIDLWN